MKHVLKRAAQTMKDVIHFEPFKQKATLYQKILIHDIYDLIKTIGKLKPKDLMLFDAIKTQSIFDFVEATVLQEQLLPKMERMRQRMMKYDESKNLFHVCDRYVKLTSNDPPTPLKMTVLRFKYLHEALMKNIMEPGEGLRFSSRGRYSTYKGKRHDYPQVSKVQEYDEVLEPIFDQYNKHLDEIMKEKDLKKSLIKSTFLASWIFYQITAIHPFPDGNGRTARVLMSRVFPQVFNLPIFMWSQITTLEIEFVDALIEAREKGGDLTRLNNLILTSVIFGLRNLLWRLQQVSQMPKSSLRVAKDDGAQHQWCAAEPSPTRV